ncbi:response regulator transcription factor [Nonomuraea sp. LPB2021202275-12-8]|uniref:response regulator transcription factor n=1 Tax=Nonomuraea sp. LPB2021202275-12-8 TaxID=3120159 RepID=UPI00300CC295
MISVLVADDQDLVRAGLVALLRAAPGFDVVGEAADGHQAVQLAASTRPHVILMDICMPGLDGIKATRRILTEATRPDRPRVLVVTTFDIDEYVYHALRAGASGFLLKQTPASRLLAAIETVAAGDVLLSPTSTRRLIEAFTPALPSSPYDSSPHLSVLTSRELQILTLVGQTLSNDEIALHLHLSPATVKTHLNRAMTKLNLSSRAHVVALAYEVGLVTPRRATG